MLFEPIQLAAAVMFLLIWALIGDITVAGRRQR
jgi:hypothetical protein